MRIVKPDHQAWDAYVVEHPKGSSFHTSAMIRVFADTNGVEPFARAMTDEEGRIVAMLVSFRVKTIPALGAMTSRALQFSEPLCNSTPGGIGAQRKLVELHDEYMQSLALFCEVRSICPPGEEKQTLSAHGYDCRDYINYVVDTSRETTVLWRNVKKKMRQKIRSSHKKGIEVRDDNSPDGVRRLYSLLQESYGRAKIPLPGLDLFENTIAQLPAECFRLRTAFRYEEPIASTISLVFGDRNFSWYGGTKRIPGLSAFACIVWEDILWCRDNGLSYYDFGGAGWPHEDYGPRKFKASFGGEEVRYSRYLKTYSPSRLKVAKFAYQMSRKLGAWS